MDTLSVFIEDLQHRWGPDHLERLMRSLGIFPPHVNWSQGALLMILKKAIERMERECNDSSRS